MKTDKKIITYKQLTSLSKKAKQNGQTIVFTSGCYDILHIGHVIHFSYCKSKGDVLVVSLGSDKNIRLLKGEGRPINNESFRARMLAALELIDFVVISQESGIMDHNKIVSLLKPDSYIVPGTDSMLTDKKKLIESVGCKLIACKRLPPGHLKDGISTTKLNNKINALKA